MLRAKRMHQLQWALDLNQLLDGRYIVRSSPVGTQGTANSVAPAAPTCCQCQPVPQLLGRPSEAAQLYNTLCSSSQHHCRQAVRNKDDLECLACPPKYRDLKSFWRYYTGAATAPFPTIFGASPAHALGSLLTLPC